ncbi:MAG: bifunctional nuclease family protein [Armatimonadetes bacterium]|nr:bifunctional nuclease family protein [Armatimonadota bacterium]MDW8122156.1 bifunctional nuclease family protein [Armatimonadota bacterium]
MVSVKVETIAQDPWNGLVVILREPESRKVLPIWIGQAEAYAIALELRGEKLARPLTHDLMKNMLEELQVNVVRVVINKVMDRVYFASIFLENQGQIREIDSRPSDAIALALRTRTPIYLDGEVLNNMVDLNIEGEEEQQDLERFRELMKKLEMEEEPGAGEEG